MKKTCSLLLVLILPLFALAHESNRSFFKIEQKEFTIEVMAEFPWTIRNALLIFAPELNKSKSQKEFDSAFFKYINTNFILTNSNGTQLMLLNVKEIRSVGHSHQTTFLLTFDGSSFNKVLNTISFNLENNQENFHKINLNDEILEFKTLKENSSFKISSQQTASSNFLWALIFLGIPVALLKRKYFN